MTHADLYNANLERVNLTSAKLKGAHLIRANLRCADLTSADLREARLFDSNVSQAKMAETRFMTHDQTVFLTRDLHGTIVYLEKDDYVASSAASFLDLATCHSVEEATFSTVNFFTEYLCKAFEYAHECAMAQEGDRRKFAAYVKERIRTLGILCSTSDPPTPLVETARAITSELIKYLSNHPQAMYEIRPRQFEELIAEILAHYGWEVNLTPPTRDGGYDLFAISKDAAGVRTSWIIECKKYRQDRKVGIDVVRSLYGVKMNLKVANMLLATTSYFTKGVHAFKASRYDLQLRDYEGILEWLNAYKPNPNGKLYIKDDMVVLPGDEEVKG